MRNVYVLGLVLWACWAAWVWWLPAGMGMLAGLVSL
jgi:hypothetical protein